MRNINKCFQVFVLIGCQISIGGCRPSHTNLMVIEYECTYSDNIAKGTVAIKSNRNVALLNTDKTYHMVAGKNLVIQLKIFSMPEDSLYEAPVHTKTIIMEKNKITKIEFKANLDFRTNHPYLREKQLIANGDIKSMELQIGYYDSSCLNDIPDEVSGLEVVCDKPLIEMQKIHPIILKCGKPK